MSMLQEYASLADSLDKALVLPHVSQIYLPPLSSDKPYRDEFGIVTLDDGSCGPFYATLPGELDALHGSAITHVSEPIPAMNLMQGLQSDELIPRAVALGVFNAVSQHVFRAALGVNWINEIGCRPDRSAPALVPEKGEWVGMVGFFRPLVEQLTDQGIKVLVLERQPGRVEVSDHVHFTENIDDLSQCRMILCTAATLVNDSLDSILEASAQAHQFNIVGPSGSGLPDVLFAHGVDKAGGVSFPSSEALMARLEAGESWKRAGQKYELDRLTYPGVESLLRRLV